MRAILRSQTRVLALRLQATAVAWLPRLYALWASGAETSPPRALGARPRPGGPGAGPGAGRTRRAGRRQCTPLPRGAGSARAGRARQPRQGRVPGHGLARAAHAARGGAPVDAAHGPRLAR